MSNISNKEQLKEISVFIKSEFNPTYCDAVMLKH